MSLFNVYLPSSKDTTLLHMSFMLCGRPVSLKFFRGEENKTFYVGLAPHNISFIKKKRNIIKLGNLMNKYFLAVPKP